MVTLQPTECFRGKIRNNIIQTWLGAIHTIADEVKVCVGTVESGIGFQCTATDASHVAMIETKIAPKMFDEYHLKEPFEFGMDVDMVKDILKSLGDKNALVEIVVDDKKFTLGTDNNRVSLNLVDTTNMYETKVPNISANLFAAMTAFKKPILAFLKIAGKISDHLAVEGNQNEVHLKANVFNTNMASDFQLATTDAHIAAPFVSLYALDFFERMIKSSLSDRVTFSVGNDFPIKISSADGGMSAMFLLAPRIMSDDDLHAPAETPDATPAPQQATDAAAAAMPLSPSNTTTPEPAAA